MGPGGGDSAKSGRYANHTDFPHRVIFPNPWASIFCRFSTISAPVLSKASVRSLLEVGMLAEVAEPPSLVPINLRLRL